MLKLDLSRDLRDTSHGVLFWPCYLAFATTSFIFIVRTQIINGLGLEFALSETQKGEIRHGARKTALVKETLLPVVMFVGFVLLIVHFKRRGGYRAISIQRQ